MAVIRDVMPVFELYQPGSIDDAVSLLDRNGTDALVLAGGLDSMDWLKDRLKKPRVVVDLGTIKELKGVREANGVGIVRLIPRCRGTVAGRSADVSETARTVSARRNLSRSPHRSSKGESSATRHCTEGESSAASGSAIPGSANRQPANSGPHRPCQCVPGGSCCGRQPSAFESGQAGTSGSRRRSGSRFS